MEAAFGGSGSERWQRLLRVRFRLWLRSIDALLLSLASSTTITTTEHAVEVVAFAAEAWYGVVRVSV